MILWKKYTPEEYPHYDNYDAIEVAKTIEIPQDYDGVMGVPITFLDKYNPEQFVEIGSLEKVEALSGATIAYKQFLEAAEKPLNPHGKQRITE
jgi:major membrane immunogen (membrane-anchored lipoprotein)